MNDSFSLVVHGATFDNCGNYVADAVVDAWQITGEAKAFLSSQQTSSIRINAHKGATLTATSMQLGLQSGSLAASVPLQVRWTLSSTLDLVRWYRADSLPAFANGDAIGTPLLSPLDDLGGDLVPFPAVVTTSGREARLSSSLFARPTLQLCGVSSGCSGITSNSALRISSNYGTFANSDLTIVFVVARANDNVNFLLANQSAGNNTGAFMGFTSGTNFRFSVAGPFGSPQINATIAPYSGPPTLEIWTARLDTQLTSSGLGMQIYRNGQLIASQAIVSQQSSAATIPFIGTPRNDHNSANFHFGELAVYKRALSEDELCRVHQFLSNKWSLGLELGCR